MRRRATTIHTLAVQSNGRFNGIRIELASTEGNNTKRNTMADTLSCMWRTMATYICIGREILKKYCMKDESRVAGPWSDQKVYMGKDLPGTLWDWQEEVKARCFQEADDRTINYIVDRKGRMGKSKFCKYMGWKHNAVCIPWGKTGDILNYIVKVGARTTYVFDLSRTKPQDWAKDDISAAMEQIKNGYIVNWKFETGAFYMDPPHIWCFSNELPNLKSMSMDRWKLWEIDDLHRLVVLTSHRLKELSRELHRDRSASPRRNLSKRVQRIELD